MNNRFAKKKPLQAVIVSGGLGNQLFQYAFAKVVKKALGVEVFLVWPPDYSFTRKYSKRKWMLDHFNIDLPILSFRQRLLKTCKAVLKRPATLFLWKPAPSQWVYERSDLFPYNHLRHEQRAQAFSSEYYRQGQDVLSLLKHLQSDRRYIFSGYWESAAMVDHVRDELEDLTFLSRPSAGTGTLLERIRHLQDPVAIHMRTNWQLFDGDRIFERPIFRQRVLPLSYYRQAINRIREKCPDPVFFVFADDIKAAASHLENLDMPDRFVYVEPAGRQVWEDIFLMKHCRHFILANSTFGWWGCWFGIKERSGKRLCIMPDDWLGYHSGELLAARLQVSQDCICQ